MLNINLKKTLCGKKLCGMEWPRNINIEFYICIYLYKNSSQKHVLFENLIHSNEISKWISNN